MRNINLCKRELRESLDRIAKFCLENLDKTVTVLTQAEFDALYAEYYRKILELENIGYDEMSLINEGLMTSIEIPKDREQDFFNWFSKRMVVFFSKKEEDIILN